jgi:predicted nuclease of predicted toxin-antitoxin system
MKFLADMGISPATVAFLIAEGYDAIHLLDQQLGRLPDVDIFEKARQESRIILTHDLDFADILAATQALLPSVIIFRLRNMKPKNVNQTLRAILSQHQADLTHGAVISVTEGQIRRRQLPLL